MNIKISVVNYINSRPFIDSLLTYQTKYGYQLSMDVPAECAKKLESKEANVGLIPVAVLALHPEYTVVSDYCIGANGKVRTVVLVANNPIDKLSKIYLDPHSRSSNGLAKVLANEYWNIEPEWDDQPSEELNSGEGKILIGDKVFDQENDYLYKYDLAEEWKLFTGMPFVFAVWASNGLLNKEEAEVLNFVLKEGISNLNSTIETASTMFPSIDLKDYFTKNIDYQLDEQKKSALNLYLQKLQKL